MKNPTPEELKSEAIKKAWIAEIGEEIYNSVKSEISAVNGKLYYYVLTDNGFNPTNDRFENMQNLWWPKSIQGIENNNGWIQRDEDSTFEPNWYWVKKKDGDEEIAFYAPHRDCFGGVDADIYVSEVTHFQLINKPKPPIF